MVRICPHLVFRAFEAVLKVYTIPAPAVKEVPHIEYFVRMVTGEDFGRGNLPAALILRGS